MTDCEVIAVKSKRIIYFSIFFALIIAVIIAEMAFMFVKLVPVSSSVGAIIYLPIVVMIVIVAAMIFVYLYNIVCWFRTPQVIISRCGDKLYFCGNEFSVSDIVDVRYFYGWGRHYNTLYSGFKIFLKDGRVLKNNYIADVEGVHAKLFSLVAQSKNTGDNQ